MQGLTINNKILFLDIFTDTSNICKFTAPSCETPTNINPCILNFHSEYLLRYKQTIKRAELISSCRIIFLNELINIKQTLINNRFPNCLADEEIKHFIKTLNNIT